MHSVATLAFLPDLFGVGRPTFVTRTASGEKLELSAAQVSALSEPVVSYETNLLVDQLRAAGYSPPRALIEIGDALKLRAGRSKNDGGVKAWDFWRELHRSGPGSGQDPPLTKELFFSRIAPPLDVDVKSSLERACDLLSSIWVRSAEALNERSEYDRFLQVEVGVQSIFFRRQASGIRLDQSAVHRFTDEAKAEKYRSYVEVAETLGVSPTGLTFRNVGKYLERTDAAHLAPFCDTPNVEEHFKIAAETSSFAATFANYMRASRDVATLNRMLVPEERIFPFFHVMGTVTGRILVSEPHLQQLRRRYRGALRADDEFALVYLDYRQFEPGIMAHLSGDQGFIEAYNSTDLYTSLSTAVFGNGEHRKLCKRVFLAFSYGMTRKGLATLLSGNNPETGQREEIEARLSRFFDAYPGLEFLKRSLERRLLEDGYISSLWGNRRYRLGSGPLEREEKRWSVSQCIQGTASLIFKEAVLEIASETSPDYILLPMHDAILLQFPEKHVAELTERASAIMANAFAHRCPSIRPKISEEPFASA